jgi:hypothetical protein
MMLLSPLANGKWFENRAAGDWLDIQIADGTTYNQWDVRSKILA